MQTTGCHPALLRFSTGVQSMKLCPRCGARNHEKNLFCHTCTGSFLPQPVDEATPKAQAEPAENTRRTVIAVVLIVLLIMACGVLCYVACMHVNGASESVSHGCRRATIAVRGSRLSPGQHTAPPLPASSARGDAPAHRAAGLPATSSRMPSSISTPLCQE